MELYIWFSITLSANILIFNFSCFFKQLPPFYRNRTRFRIHRPSVENSLVLIVASIKYNPRTEKNIENCFFHINLRPRAWNTSKRARRKNLRRPRERFLLVSNSAEPRWRPEMIVPSFPLTGVRSFILMGNPLKYAMNLCTLVFWKINVMSQYPHLEAPHFTSIISNTFYICVKKWEQSLCIKKIYLC
jgi:hypothetical protein